MFGAVKSEDRRRCFAVAVRAWRGGRRWEADVGVRMGVRKAGCGGGRDCERRDWVRSVKVGDAIFGRLLEMVGLRWRVDLAFELLFMVASLN
jgi:hypothetical protein